MTSEEPTKERASSILVVHGRDFKPSAESLSDIVSSALRSGIERDCADHIARFDTINKHLAYYGDLTNALLESNGRRYDEHMDIGDRSNALNELRSIAARKRFGIRQYDCLPGKSAVPEFLAGVVAPTLGAVGLTMPLISKISKDFAEYLTGKTDYADRVRARVRGELCKLLDRGDRILLLAHGTGSAIAYDVLWQLSHEPEYGSKYEQSKIDAWVTLGSPLGDHNIRKRLFGAKAERSFPTNVISWHNVSAEDDYTCHDNTLADDYKKMLRQRAVSAVHDYQIYNHAVRYGKSNPHSSVGYYIHPRVTKIVVDWLLSTEAERVT